MGYENERYYRQDAKQGSKRPYVGGVLADENQVQEAEGFREQN